MKASNGHDALPVPQPSDRPLQSPIEVLARRQAQISFLHDGRVLISTLNPARHFERRLDYDAPTSAKVFDKAIVEAAREILKAEGKWFGDAT